MNAYRETFWHDVNGTLEVRYPSNCRVSLSGSQYHGWTLVIHRVIPQHKVRVATKRKGRKK